jgi:hypothetical protein
LIIAACNRSALAIFIDFSTAFDRLWWPALFHTLEKLEMPIELRKWIFNWLQNRWMRISHREAKSRLFPISIGAPQTSVLTPLLFRLHIHFLPLYFPQIVSHLFAGDLTLITKGALGKLLSENIDFLQFQANAPMKELEEFSDNYLPPGNVAKTKAMLVNSVVKISKPKFEYKRVPIEFIIIFKCVGVHIGAKSGWSKFIDDRLKKVRQSYGELRKIFQTISKNEIRLRRQLFLVLSLPQFEEQKTEIQHAFGTDLRLVYSLQSPPSKRIIKA